MQLPINVVLNIPSLKGKHSHNIQQVNVSVNGTIIQLFVSDDSVLNAIECVIENQDGSPMSYNDTIKNLNWNNTHTGFGNSTTKKRSVSFNDFVESAMGNSIDKSTHTESREILYS